MNETKKFSILLTGDIILGDDPEYYLSGVRKTLEQSDVVLGQLEVPYSDRAPELEGLSRTPRALEPLANYVDALTLVSNHLLDGGAVGVEDTLAWMKEHHIPVTGGGMTLEEASRPVILEHDGVKIGYISYNCVGPKETYASASAPGNPYVQIISHFEMGMVANPGGAPDRIYTWPEPESFKRMKREIGELRKKVDLVVVYFHKGIVHKPVKLADYEQIVSYAAIEAGADVVSSSHSHILHGVEIYKDKTIFHGLNNFVAWVPSLAPGFKRRGGRDTELFNPEEWVRKRVERFGFVPLDYPTYPFHPEAVYTMAGKCIVEDGRIIQTRCIPMMVGRDGVTRTVTRDNGGQEVMDYLQKITEGADLNGAFHWDGDEIVISER